MVSKLLIIGERWEVKMGNMFYQILVKVLSGNLHYIKIWTNSSPVKESLKCKSCVAFCLSLCISLLSTKCLKK